MKTYMIISTSWSDKCVIEFTGKNVEAFNLLFNSQTMYTEEGWGTLLETNSKGKPVSPPSIKLATQSEVDDMIVKGKVEREEKIRAMLDVVEENEAAE
jgi:hypothetical protein